MILLFAVPNVNGNNNNFIEDSGLLKHNSVISHIIIPIIHYYSLFSFSDAIATIEIYHKLIENENIDQEKKRSFRNALYGIGIGRDNENTIKYLKDAIYNLIINNINNANVNFTNNAILIILC